MQTPRSRNSSERGAVLIQVAVCLLALLAFTAFVVDYGVMWASRGQAQTSADAGALSGALALAYDSPSDFDAAKAKARATALQNSVWGAQPNDLPATVQLTDVTFPSCPPPETGGTCVRVDAFRNQTRGNALPVFFGNLVGVGTQGVRATATAQVASGNQVKCMLPFAAIDRWADNYDPTPVMAFFPNDGMSGTAGWTPNDSYEPTPTLLPAPDVYIPPYDGNTSHTGWKVTSDYGRQLILKDGSVGNYSTGWSQLVCLNGPANCGGSEIGNWIATCNPQPVGIATAGNACTVGDEPNGCIDVKTGGVVGQVRAGVDTLVASDPAVWNPTANGPAGPGKGAVTGGQGMASPRIRGMVVLDINHYVASDCTGGTCVGKVANIIGFFLEGICNTVTLDPGLACDDPNKDVVGRIVTLPSQYVVGAGESVEDGASFIKVVRLVR